jgi:hypothetical protein
VAKSAEQHETVTIASNKPLKLTRAIRREVERELWGRTAARCEFNDCNRLLYKSPVTQEPVNLAEMAHIYSFSKDGPRGWGIFTRRPSALNDVGNLMLVCHDCHKKIDQDKKGERYPADLLRKWKDEHEARVRIATGISANKKSHVVLYGSRIGDENSPLQTSVAFDAMFPDWNPADDRSVNLSMQSALDDSTKEFWITEAAHLRREFDRHIRVRVTEAQPNHFSVFALASQPLLILLGSLFTDKVPAVVYQPHREPKTWKWQPHPDGFQFRIIEPPDKSGIPVLVFSLSAKIAAERIESVLGDKVSIWEVTIDKPHNDFLRSEAQLSMFRETARKLIVAIKAAHSNASDLKIFPAMPVSCAVELGRVRMPKADLPWIIYDQNHKHQRFIEAITIGSNHD